MKTILTALIIAIGFTANAMDLTGRLEIRDSTTASSTCGSAPNCSANSVMGFGVGVTTNVWAFDSDWGLVTGGLLRQRIGSVSGSGTTQSGTYLDLDIPVAAQWSSASFAVRLGVDLGFKLSSTYSNISSSALSDNSLVIPVELAFDWKFVPNQMVSLSYETGTTLATGQNGGNSLATGSIISIGYGYTF